MSYLYSKRPMYKYWKL